MKDKNLPSKEDVKKSGTQDWLDQAMREQERKNRQLGSMLDQDAETLRRRQDELAGMLGGGGLPAEDEGPPAPDLFAQEREAGRAKKASLADIFGGEKSRKEQENQELLGMFGFEARPKAPPSKKKRR